MNEFSAEIFDQLDGYTPEPGRRPDWRDVVVRARKQRTHRLLVVLAAAVIVLGSATAVTAALGGFDSWLVGEPGKPASNAEQERFAAANRSLDSFPKNTKLRQLVRANVGGKQYELYGFRSGASLCLRLKAVSLGHSIGPTCASVSKVERATAPVVVVVGNDGFQNRHGRPSAAVSFGIAADGVSRVEVRAVDGVHRAALGGKCISLGRQQSEHRPACFERHRRPCRGIAHHRSAVGILGFLRSGCRAGPATARTGTRSGQDPAPNSRVVRSQRAARCFPGRGEKRAS